MFRHIVRLGRQGTDHTTQQTRLRTYLDGWHQSARTVPVVVDAVGEGSALADQLARTYATVERFTAGATARDQTEYRDCRTEALAHLGAFLADDGALADQSLREELMAAARTVAFDEHFVASRGQNGATVLKATSKDAITDRLGRSPDHLDAAAMAVWGHEVDLPSPVRLTW